MMRLDFSHEFLDENGNGIRFREQERAILKDLAIHALLHAAREGQKEEPSGQEKKHRYELAMRIKNFGSNTVLGDEDVKLLKEVIGGAYHTLIAGPALQMLDGAAKPSIASPSLMERSEKVEAERVEAAEAE